MPPVASTQRAPATALCLALAVGAVLIFATGAAPILIYPADTAIYLDACHAAAARLTFGRDVFWAVGPSALVPTTLALDLGIGTVRALSIGALIAWIGYGCLAWTTARRYLEPWIASAFSLFAAATAAAPYTLDFGNWRVLSYAMLYNRLAWAALCIVAVPSFLRPKSPFGWVRWDLALHGACAAFLALDKPNFLLMQAPLALWTLARGNGLRERFPRDLATGVAAAAAVSLAVWSVVPYDPLGIFRELRGMAGEAPADLLQYTLKRSLRENLLPLGLLAAGWLASALAAPAGGRPGGWLSSGLLAAATAAAVFVANMTNCQFAEFPVWGAMGWILAAHSLQYRSATNRLIAALGVILGLAFTWQPLASLPYAYLEKRHLAATGQAASVDSPSWSGMPMRPYPSESSVKGHDPGDSAGDFAIWLNDGLALLKKYQPHAKAVVCLDWANPFPFALNLEPVKGDQVAWHVGRYIGPHHHPDADRILSQADTVMEPKQSLQPGSLDFKRALFAQGLKASFVLAGESAYWRIWICNSPGPPAHLDSASAH